MWAIVVGMKSVYRFMIVSGYNQSGINLYSGKISQLLHLRSGGSVVTVDDVRAPQYVDFEEEKTRKMARGQYVHDKLDAYVVNCANTS